MTPEAARDKRLQRLYGITADEYDRILVGQKGVCFICQRPPKTIRLSVDHDHATGWVRGLLCNRCNRMLRERVTAEDMRRASDYLRPGITIAAAILGRQPVGVKGRIGTKRRRKRATVRRATESKSRMGERMIDAYMDDRNAFCSFGHWLDVQ